MQKLTEKQALAYITGEDLSDENRELITKIGVKQAIKQSREKWVSLEGLAEILKDILTEEEILVLIKYLNLKQKK